MDSLLIAQDLTWTSPEWWWAVAQVCIGLGFVIFIHELGHFLVAKACGVKCEKFYVGFDFFDIKIGDMVLVPRSLLKFQWGETEYGVGIVPLGGYVKMLGQDDNPGNMEQEIQRSKADGQTDSGEEHLGDLDRDKMDPRSFLAKSVPQRMAIISAGVVFNLISAVIIAAIAFKSGVNFNPPIIGDVTAGGPAWESNLYGAHVSQIADSKVQGYYPFMDLAQEVVLNSGGEPIDIQFSYPNSEEIRTVNVTPRKGVNNNVDFALLGVQSATLPKVTDNADLFIEGHPAALAEPSFNNNDVIVEVAGSQIRDIFDLKRKLAANFDSPLEFVVERQVSEEKDSNTEKVTIRVERNPMREMGLVMEWGPVTAVQQGSPAVDAGIRVGDQIVKIDGEPVGDLYKLEQRMTRISRDGQASEENGKAESKANKQSTFTVSRDGKLIDISIAPRIPEYFSSLSSNQSVAVNSVGIAVRPTRKVARSEIESVKAGDEITKFEFVAADENQKSILKKRAKKSSIDLVKSKTSWVVIEQLVQYLPAGFEFKVTTDSGHEAVGKTKPSDDYFVHTRGVLLSQKQVEYKSETWSDALALGAKQTYRDGSRIFQFLGKLVSGQISPKNLGGPGLIAAAATSEAKQGTSRLLLFLTLLSANLAIVNFLPIPVLDGGHMLFLAYEGVFRQPPNEQVQIILTYAGLFMILGLMLFVILMDVQRFTGWF